MAARAPHAVSRCLVLLDATRMYLIHRDLRKTNELAGEVIALSTEHEIGLLPWGTMIRAYATVLDGRKEEGITEMCQSLDAIRAMGMKITISPGILMLAAAFNEAGRVEEGLAAVAEALETAQSAGEQFIEPEIHRLRGEMLLKQAASKDTPPVTVASESREATLVTQAEECFLKAIDVAREQGAKSVELRAVMSLASLYQKQQRSAEAREMLTGLYGSFTEGFETPDLKDAARLLERLSS